MAFPQGTCPSGYSWYTCAAPPYKGCCSVDPCSPSTGCPPGKEYLFNSDSPVTTLLPPTTEVASASRSSVQVTTSRSTRTITGPSSPPSTLTDIVVATASPTQESAPVSPTQRSVAASPTQSNTKGSGPTSSPLLFIIAISIGGVLAIVIIVIAIILCRRRRRRKRKNSAGGLPSHSSLSEPSPNDGPVTGFFSLFKRTHPIPAETTTVLTGSPSTTYPELPSPSFPQHSVVPGFAELPSPQMSPVSELSSGDRELYSSTDVSTASDGAVVSPTPHETLRGGNRPAMMPNMVSRGREGRRKHALSWQSLDPGDGH